MTRLLLTLLLAVVTVPLGYAQTSPVGREQALADATLKGDVERVRAIIAAGALDFAKDVTAAGTTYPLTRFVIEVSQGALPGDGPRAGDTRVLEIVRALFAAGANPNFSWEQSAARSTSSTTYWVVERVAARDDTALLDVLIDAGLDVKGAGAGEALITAAERGHATVVARLIAAGADVNHRQRKSGRTALSEAVHMGRREVIALLDAAGAREWVEPPPK